NCVIIPFFGSAEFRSDVLVRPFSPNTLQRYGEKADTTLTPCKKWRPCKAHRAYTPVLRVLLLGQRLQPTPSVPLGQVFCSHGCFFRVPSRSRSQERSSNGVQASDVSSAITQHIPRNGGWGLRTWEYGERNGILLPIGILGKQKCCEVDIYVFPPLISFIPSGRVFSHTRDFVRSHTISPNVSTDFYSSWLEMYDCGESCEWNTRC
ncbi:hypothetical protein BCV70DRAFT_221698, partial [Testicularia cyperi]